MHRVAGWARGVAGWGEWHSCNLTHHLLLWLYSLWLYSLLHLVVKAQRHDPKPEPSPNPNPTHGAPGR
eukprot:scaffold105586_cov48-Phaeocystis_antarctica.AAC.1